jgi:hypothetical protein
VPPSLPGSAVMPSLPNPTVTCEHKPISTSTTGRVDAMSARSVFHSYHINGEMAKSGYLGKRNLPSHVEDAGL